MRRWLGYPLLMVAFVCAVLGTPLLILAFCAEWLAARWGCQLRNRYRFILGTSSVLEVSPAVYAEVAAKLKWHSYAQDELIDGRIVTVLDMQDVVLAPERGR